MRSVGCSAGREIHECDSEQAEPRVFLLRQKPRVRDDEGGAKSGGEEEPVEIPIFGAFCLLLSLVLSPRCSIS